MNGGLLKEINGLNLNVEIVKKYKLSNGIRLLLIPMLSNLFAAGIYIKSGSANETSNYGIAHFLEHMTFKGTTSKTSHDINDLLESLGSLYNASTTAEYTNYYISGNPTDAEQLIELLLDLYKNPIYPQKDIEIEKRVVIEELRMSRDDSIKTLLNKIRKNLFLNHPDL
jgi:predicted Zn-dependent peptidase